MPLEYYIAEGKITDTTIGTWPLALKQVVQLSKIQLLDFFNQSTYSIIDQQIERPFDEKEWKDLFQLINLGHYALTAQQIQSGINFYNANAENKISNLATIRFEQGDIERRLTERLMHIKPLKRFTLQSPAAQSI